VKRKIVQLLQDAGPVFYAVADDGSWWRLLGDPLSSSWTQMPDLPQPEEPEPFKPKVRSLAAAR
jgi:hypothetical protein